MKHTFGLWIIVTAGLLLAACAQGVGGTGDDDDDVPIDAKRIDAPQVIDGPQAIDARVIDGAQPIDARVIDAPGLPDALTGMCTVDTDCAPADCCFAIACVPGTRTGLPSPLNCIPS